MNMRNDEYQKISKKITTYGMLIAVGAAIYILESYAPFPVPIPGARWGFSNMVVVYALPDTPLSWLVVLTIGKSLIGSLLGGTFLAPTFLMGFVGSIGSTFMMYLSFRSFKKVGLIFHSTVGALLNNLIQVLIGVQIVGTWAIMSYLPYMEIIGIFSGIANAIVAGVLIKRIKS
ncbi:MAG: Gx transporter family protein [Thermotogae bacterium]|jgi:heptaprenyl diphosphate synthase|nr:Gx transporter family protein [Thermotogota bacterium]